MKFVKQGEVRDAHDKKDTMLLAMRGQNTPNSVNSSKKSSLISSLIYGLAWDPDFVSWVRFPYRVGQEEERYWNFPQVESKACFSAFLLRDILFKSCWYCGFALWKCISSLKLIRQVSASLAFPDLSIDRILV